MIDKARATGLYDALEVADMLRRARGRPAASADLVLAADAMVYLGDLAPLLIEAARARCRPAGCSPSRWRPMAARASFSADLRYAHARGLCAVAVAAGRPRGPVRSGRPVRRERDNVPVPGLVASR